MELIAFWVLSAVVVLCALLVLFGKNLLNAALALLLCFLGVAGIFILCKADFVAVSQLLVYIGGILVLIVFGVFLSPKKLEHKFGATIAISNGNQNQLLAIVVSLLLLGTTIFFIWHMPFGLLEGRHFAETTTFETTIQKLGLNFLLDYSIAFELVGILLLGALIAAGYIAKKAITTETES
jgi:NADH-quinone oxidoreductase subunit J